MNLRAISPAIACLCLLLTGCPKTSPQGGKAQATSATPPSMSSPTTSASTPAAPVASSPPPPSAVRIGAPSGRLCVGGAHSCYLDPEHTPWCWGNNMYGQVGIGTYGHRGRTENTDLEHFRVNKPTRVAPLAGKVGSIHCGTSNTCALTLDGAVYCWGYRENPARSDIAAVPVRREFGAKIARLALSKDHSCAISEDHTLWCWGAHGSGQLGAGTFAPGTPTYEAAIPIKTAGSAVELALILNQATCVLNGDGALWCWGQNDRGELGDGGFDAHLEAVRAAGAERFRLVSAAGNHVCGVTLDERLLCWGKNTNGQLGNGETLRKSPHGSPTAVSVVNQPKGIRALALGDFSTLVSLENGDLYAWGDLTMSMRGFEPSPVLTPKKVTMPGKVVDIAANSPHRCALLADDSVWCWGSGTMLELGDGKEEARDKPVRVVFPK